MGASTDRYDVVIAGGGSAGLALACALADALGTARIAVVDPGPLPGRGGPMQAEPRAFAVSAGAKRMLTVLGAWPSLAAHAQPVTAVDITDSSLEDAFRPVLVTYDNTVDGGEPATYIVEQGRLREVLLAAARDRATIGLIGGARAVAFKSDEHGVSIELAGHDQCSLRARLLVAADGRQSPLRAAAGIGVVRWNYPQVAITTTVGLEQPHAGRATQHFLPSGPFAILPLPGDRASITWTEDRESARAILALDDAGFRSEVAKRFGYRLGAITLAGPRASWQLETHLARALIAERFALLGDAAHGVHPIAGQGLNLGLRDVAALAEVVADAAHLGLDIGSVAVLERYERWRRLDSALSAAAFDALNRLFSNDWTPLRSARDFGLGLVERMPGLKRLFVAEAAGLTGDVPRLLRGEPV